MADEALEAPVTLPESTTFDEYVASRMESAHDDFMAAVVEPDLVADAPNPESGQTPEPTEPAPVTESTTAVAAEPAAPEPAAEPVTVEETQEQKEQREKKQGIPQERFNEVTKARREAERERDAVKAENERLAKELAEAKTVKPPEPAKPEPVAAAADKPVAPETPALEDFGGDWDAYQVGLKKFNRDTYPAYVEQLADWKAEQREIANKKKADDTAAATRKQAEDAARQDTEKAEADSAKDWNSRFQAVKDANPEFEQKLTTTPASAAMRQAILDMDDGPELAHWLTEHQDEAKRIFDLTGTDKPLPAPQFRKAVLKAAKEFAKIDFESTPVAEPVAVAAAATAVTSTPPALPVNPKPNTTKAPRPPSPVQERGAAAAKDPAKATSFAEYEAARMAARTATRR